MTDTWMQKHWRPLLAIAYIAVIIFDFVLGPVYWSGIQALFEGSVTTPWEPLTLKSGGLFHATIGAILGVTSFTRGQEKLARVRKE